MPHSEAPITGVESRSLVRIEQLEYFAAVTRHGSLRRASDGLHVSQPAVSEAISKLERELGVTLLDRSRTGSRISAAGQELLQPILGVLEAVAHLREAAGHHVVARGLVRVGSVNGGTVSLALPAIRSFQEHRPTTTVEIRSMQQDEIQAGLVEGSLDVGLVNLLDGDDIPPELQATVLLTGRPVAVLPADHRLTAADCVSVEDLRAERFVAMRSGYLMHRFAHRLFGADLPSEWHTTDGAEMGKMMVAEHIGVTILPDYSVAGDPLERGGLITSRAIRDDRTTVRLALVHRRQRRLPAPTREFIESLTTTAASA